MSARTASMLRHAVMASLAMAATAAAAAGAYGAGFAAWASQRWPAQGRMLDTGDVTLHVTERGQPGARPVVLVHGAASNQRDMMLALEPVLAPDFRLIAFDRPGLGHSPPARAADRLGLHAQALARLMRTLRLERPILVCHSYGAAVCLRLALEAPDAAAGAILLAPASHGDVGPVAWYNHAAAAPLVGALFTRLLIPIAGPLAARAGAGDAFAPQALPDGYAADVGDRLLFRPASFASNAADLARVNEELLAQQPRYPDIAWPVAILAGTADQVVSTDRHAGRLAETLPNARLQVLEGVGHMPHHAAPDAVAEAARALAGRTP